MSHNLSQWVPESVTWLVAGLVMFGLVAARLAETKKNIAELLGPPGRWLFRRFEHNELLRREERQREFREAIKRDRTADYKAMQRRVDILYGLFKESETEIEKLKAIEKGHEINWDMTASYLREDARWHITVGVKMAEMGIKLPRHRSYSQFCREYKVTRGIEEEEGGQ